MRNALASVLAVLLGCHHPAPAPAPHGHVKLVVLLVVDQLPTWAFEKQKHLFTGGFARLLREGGYVAAAEIPFANTYTAPGHAAIGTGAPPTTTGIVGNAWYRRADGKERAAEYDPDAAILPVGPPQGAVAPTDDDGASARGLRTDGLADVLRRATDNRARSIAIALKARAACLMTGRKPDLAVWYEPGAGGMTTSRAYADEAPKWLVALAHDHPASAYFTRQWDPLDAALLARETGIADDAPGEGDEHGLGKTFPHDLAASDAPAKALVQTPFADELVLRTADAAIDALELGRDDAPDLLAISLGAHDFAGHLWGPNSWETLDLTLRLDRSLGDFFAHLDAKLGRDNWAVVLTSDHGATPMVEQSHVAGARRIPPTEIEQAAETVLDRMLGAGPWVAKWSSQDVYMTTAWSLLAPETRNDALTAAAYAIGQLPQIAAAGRVDQVSGHCADRVGLEQALCWAAVAGESGELYAVAAPGSVITEYKTGTHHEAPGDDNRFVPILVKAPMIAPQVATTGSLLQVAPTVAALLGIPAPPEANAPPLFGLVAK